VVKVLKRARKHKDGTRHKAREQCSERRLMTRPHDAQGGGQGGAQKNEWACKKSQVT